MKFIIHNYYLVSKKLFKMTVSASQRTLGKVAALLGMIQGFGWSGLSLTCIILYNMSPKNMNNTITSYSQFIDDSLYMTYLSAELNSRLSFVIRPRDFTILMWFYFLLSAGWFFGSIDQFVACHYNKKRISTMMMIWGSITGVISVIDLVLTCLLLRDYIHCGEEPNIDVSCYLAVGIVMTLAARGYILWLINVGFTFLMFCNAWEIIKKEYAERKKFGNCTIPRVQLQDPPPRKPVQKYPREENSHGMEFPSHSRSRF
nr:uncharacterized protein LOC111516292 [Leptinotarsa decemlineata]